MCALLCAASSSTPHVVAVAQRRDRGDPFAEPGVRDADHDHVVQPPDAT
ncbi:hypothetical protein ACU686_19830 [Yinghuangia aomiensis]